jgi:iron complex transport system substrate-binding protein
MIVKISALSQLCAGLLLALTAHADPPRVVSINLCTDQLTLQLADRAQIASITWMARDAALSQFAAHAAGIRVNHGLAEEILPLKPDLVLAGKYGARYTVALLRKFNYRVLEIDVARSFDEIAAQTLSVAAALDQRARGEAAVRQMRERLAALPGVASAPGNNAKPLAVMYQPNGFTAAGRSLIDEIFQLAGLDNLARRLNVNADYSYLPMEALIHAAPDVLVFDQASRQSASIAAMLLEHPALRRFAASRRVVQLPAALTACATTQSVTAVETLARVGANSANSASSVSSANSR